MYDDITPTENTPATAEREEAAPKKKRTVMKRSVKVKAKAKAKVRAKRTNGNGGLASQFGIREGGERAAILEALHKPLGKKRSAAELAKLTDSKSTTRVAGIIARIEQKAAKYKTGMKILREKTDDGRFYALQRR